MWIILLTSIISLYFHHKEFNIMYLYNENFFIVRDNFLASINNALEDFFETLNIFRIFKDTNYSPDIPFYYTFTSIYTILLAFLTYQFIVAVRRKVKR